MKVTTRFRVGGDTLDPWHYSLPVTGNVNDGKVHILNLSTAYSAGTPVTINGKSWIWTKDSKKNSLQKTQTGRVIWKLVLRVILRI